MKKRIIAGALGSLLLIAGAVVLRAKEPTVMTVNGREVPLSEFEYLYLKNQAQTQLQPLDEYAEIFKLYKLKVADAIAMGLDTTKAFKEEYEQYRKELAQPYLTDSAYLNTLVDELYGYYGRQVHPYHIMMAKTPDALENRVLLNRLDSIRHEIIDNKTDFNAMAIRYSQDRGSAQNGGDLGWTNNPNFPYAFIKSMYSLNPGEVSEIVETPVGYHLIKVAGSRPNVGYMSASHIMKRYDPNNPEDQANAKAQIDSLYAVIQANPDTFEELAVKYSDDKGSSDRGGKLQPFPQGAYPQPFDSIVFAMADNEISTPFMTPFGWHIVKRFGMRPFESKEKLQDQFITIINNPRDVRAEMIDNNLLAKLAKEFKLKPVKKNLAVIDSYIATHGIDSLFYGNVEKLLGNAPLYTWQGGTLTLADMRPQLNKLVNLDPEFAAQEFTRRTNTSLKNRLLPLKEQMLEQTNADYRNLLHEFRDGSLLYEAGRLRVWDHAATDTTGLNQFFNDHRSDYTWKQPRAKGYLIQVTNDSVLNLVNTRLATLSPEDYIPVLRQEFKDQIQIDRVLAQKGSNPIIDYLAFDGPEAKPANSRFNNFFIANLRILSEPEDILDVRGLVIADYQNYLMQQWEDDLKGKFPITVNQKVLKKVKTK